MTLPNVQSKRPLEARDINSMHQSPPLKRRNSLGFEMASVSFDPPQESTFDMSAPFSSSAPVLPLVLSQNQTKTRLPQLDHSLSSSNNNNNNNSNNSNNNNHSNSNNSKLNIHGSNKTVSNFSQEYKHQILSIQERLGNRNHSTLIPSRRESLISSSVHQKRQNQQGSQNFLVSSRTNELNNQFYAVNDQYREKQQQVARLNEDLHRLRRIHRNFAQKVETIKDEINQYNVKFEFMEETVLKAVANEEKLIDIKLEENQIKLDNQFRELEFEMMQELDEVKKFDYTELNKQIETLKEEVTKVRDTIGMKENVNRERYQQEVAIIEKELHAKLESTEKARNDSQLKLGVKNSEFEQAREGYQKASTAKINLLEMVNETKSKIRVTEEMMNNYSQNKKTFQAQLSILNEQLASELNKSKKEEAEFDQLKSRYDTIAQKIKKHDEHRRILENSIMDYQHKIRVYALTDSEPGINPLLFSKEFKIGTPSSFIIDEFSHLACSTLRGSNVTIVTQCVSGCTITSRLIQPLLDYSASKMHNWDICLYYQCVGITRGANCNDNSDNSDIIKNNNTLRDLISNTTIDQRSLFDSQKIPIDRNDQNKSILLIKNQPIIDVDNATFMVHIISVNGVRKGKGKSGTTLPTLFDTKLVVLDMSHVSPLLSQVEMLTLIEKSFANQLRRVSHDNAGTDICANAGEAETTLARWILGQSKVLVLADMKLDIMAKKLRDLSLTTLCAKKSMVM